MTTSRTGEQAVDFAEKHLLRVYGVAHDLMPILDVETDDGERHIIGCEIESREALDRIAAKVKGDFSGRVRSYMFICEGWAVCGEAEYTRQARLEWSNLVEHPDRVEVVTANYRSATDP